MSEVKIPDGYKQTEVGVIPEDWEVKDIGEALTIKHGKDQKQVESAHGQYPIFGTGGQMGWANDFLYNKPSVLIGRKGSINKPRYINVPFWTVDTLFYSQVHNGYDEKFMFYKFCLIDWMNYNEASGVPSLNASTISNVKISVPKKQEQTAIATALSDVDNLIQLLEKLITKREAIKTGTMQQLLTGKTRLPEFATRDDGSPKGLKQTELGRIPEDWDSIKVQDVCDFIVPGRNKPQKFDGDIPWITTPDLIDGRAVFFSRSRLNISKEVAKTVGSKIVPAGSVIMSCVGELGLVAIAGVNIVINQQLHAFLPSEKIDNYFLMYALKDQESYFHGAETKTALPYLNKDNCNATPLPLPSIQEQTVIASILSDMDTEIQALQQRLEKTKDLKQGMMQQLLTGKVRLAH